jgi:cytochrome c oxidase subunit IV
MVVALIAASIHIRIWPLLFVLPTCSFARAFREAGALAITVPLLARVICRRLQLWLFGEINAINFAPGR